jgi:hypothetical protein
MFAAAVGATLPFAAVPDFANSRTAFMPGAFLLAASAGAGFLCIHALVVNNNGSRPRTVGVGLVTLLLAAYAGLASLGWREAQALQPQLAGRWASLEQQAGSGADVTVPRLTGEEPLVVFAPDLSANPAYWANVFVAQFFGLKSVRVVDP